MAKKIKNREEVTDYQNYLKECAQKNRQYLEYLLEMNERLSDYVWVLNIENEEAVDAACKGLNSMIQLSEANSKKLDETISYLNYLSEQVPVNVTFDQEKFINRLVVIKQMLTEK